MFGVKRPGRQPGDSAREAGQSVGSSDELAEAGSKPAGGNGAKPAAANDLTTNGNHGTKPAPADGLSTQSTGNGKTHATASAGGQQVAAPDRRPSTAGGEPGEPGTAAVSSGGRPGKPGLKVVALGTVAVAAVAAGIVFAVTQSPGSSGRASSGPIRLTSISPSRNATGVDGADPIVVTFSGAVAGNSAKPTLTPNVPGSWMTEGDSLIFMPTTAFSPSTTVTVHLPAGPSGIHSPGGGLLRGPLSSKFTTEPYSQAGLAVLLAQQGYLPLTWGPSLTTGFTQTEGMAPAEDTPQGEAYDPPAGTYSWDPGYPSSLQVQWSPDQPNVLLQGAVMAFQSEHNMTINGDLTPQFWTALFQAQASGQKNANGYTYAVANKGSPETLTIWHNGQVVLQSLANTGIPAAPTVDGTFPVYERFLNTVMSGFNPDGSYYSDPVSFVSYFNGGDAVHYFPRGSYGYPQSLGCVELPYSDAQAAYPYLTYGSLVQVMG